MIKSDSIIAVKDVEASSRWYQQVFGCKSKHGGEKFEVLTDLNDEVVICLHKWGEHEHPTMMDSKLTPGNGIILYFRTDQINEIREKVVKNKGSIEQDIKVNPNSGKREFALRDLDGYYLIVSEYHEY